jgi:hypothetical protein
LLRSLTPRGARRVLRRHVSAALSTLNRLIEVLSVATTSPGPAPISVRDLVAQALRQFEPAGAVPGADQALAPFLLHGFGDAGGGRFGSGPSELPSR